MLSADCQTDNARLVAGVVVSRFANAIPLCLKTRYPCAMTGPQLSSEPVHIVGAGLAGSEAAWQVANAGVRVVLHEMRPHRMTEAHRTDGLAELVCSNSFRSDDAANNAVGLLHAEMRRLGSLIMRSADANQVPAGGALAVDRDGFSAAVTKALNDHPGIEIRRAEIDGLPPADWRNVIVATGPLTSAPLADAIRELTDENALAFFDAIAPIVHKDSIDMSVAWFQSRYDKVGPGGTGADYINCPMTKEQYDGFVDALLAGEKTDFKDWEANTPYFDGCLPIEVMAERGRETLRHGPMKPVGLTNPNDPMVKAYAIVQLRQDNKLGTLYNMVGFQTKLKYGPQQQIFRTIPGLAERRIRKARRPASQHVPEFAKTARWAIAAARAAAAALRRADDGMRRLCGIREHRPDRRIVCRRRCAIAVIGAAAADHGAGFAARPHHRRPYRNHRCRAALVPADEHQFRTVSAAGYSTDPKARRHPAARQRKDRRQKAGAQRPRAGRSRSLDRRSFARAGGGVSDCVPDAVRHSSCRSAEPGPRSHPSQTGPRLCSAPLRKGYALRCVRGTQRSRRPPQRPQRPQPRRRLRRKQIAIRARHALQIAAHQRQRQE